MKLFATPTYDSLAATFQTVRFADHENDFQGHEKKVRAAGLALVKFEVTNKIDIARELLQSERNLTEQITNYKQVVSSFESLNEQTQWLIGNLVTGKIGPHEISHYCKNIDNHTSELKVAKAVLAKLEASLAEVQKKKAALPPQSLVDSTKGSPITDRDSFLEEIKYLEAA
jgi:phage shock protein A